MNANSIESCSLFVLFRDSAALENPYLGTLFRPEIKQITALTAALVVWMQQIYLTYLSADFLLV